MTHIEKDLHGLTLEEAKAAIIQIIKFPQVNKITLIHGYNRGVVLRNYIWTQMASDLRAMGLTKQIRFFADDVKGRTTFLVIRADKSQSRTASIGDLIDVDAFLCQIDIEEELAESIEDSANPP
ncbi:MAG: hypothetical protein CXT69_05290 [Methanobacteriota archaeon]|nr:MAG: hypothetical protein CXT69_05290 [Euryarchaeota archaeon]